MKMIHPDIPNDLTAVADISNLLRSDDKIYAINLSDFDMQGCRLKGTIIEESRICKTNFSDVHIEKFGSKDCIFKDCNFTASNFADSGWDSIEIINTRCSGTQMQNSVLRNVLFKSCKIELVNFRFSKLENVIFKDCVINDADFYNATLKNIEFINCDIEKIAFFGAKLKSADLTTSRIISVNGVDGLKGATINYEQLITLAPYFAQAIGIVIKD